MSKNDYTRGQEVAVSKSGKVAGRYSTGDLGSVHDTIGGKTTLHPDGSSHHHGDHAHVAGGKQSYTRNGEYSKK